MTCDQADMEQERIYPASYPVAAPKCSFLLRPTPPPAPRRGPSRTSWVVPPLTLPTVLRLKQARSRAGSSTTFSRSVSGGREPTVSDGPVWEGDNEGEDDEEEQQKGMTGEEDDDEEEGGVFKLDGDDDDHAAHGGSIGSTPDLGMSDAEEDEFGLPFLDIDAGPGPCASAGAGSSAGPGAGAKFVLAGGGGDDDGGRSKGGGGPKGAGSKLLGHSWAGSAGSIPLGTSPILQMALRQLAAEGHAFDAKDLGAASQILRGFALPRQTTI
mmetsp:Transcript_61232/g.200172  ORF Transcript_61232/g.200172 Transcript_61232/m.200172 type:complete len:269 (+) Transcript_61232:98-904(+)